MGRYAGRFVVDVHVHAQRAAVKFAERGVKTPSMGDVYAGVAGVTWHENSGRLLYDMDRYGIDVCILQCGGLARGMDTDLDLKLVEQHPDRFAALCYPTDLVRKAAAGEAEWTVAAALAETEERLKTGLYKGIGQGLPITEMGSFGELWAAGDSKKKAEVLSESEVLDRTRMFMDLADKYNVAVAGLAHDEKLIGRIAAEYPKVPIVLQLVGHGWKATTERVKSLCTTISRAKNVYLEMGLAPAELYEIPLSDPNLGPTQIVFGTDWGASHYVYSQPGRPIRGEAFTSYVDWIGKWGAVRYQTDFYGWSLHQIDKLRDMLTQDEINLMLGGNAARIFKLDVPYTRLFPEGRVDLWGIDWGKSIPFIPREQITETRQE
ncbi:MAG: amidohydrolase family protein [Chloroflexi bacterium]|nr:amidohydrolase family protein [Chloroflexota bacterium]